MAADLTSNERDHLLAQNHQLATLAGGLAHEIRNPLSTILMNLELLAEDLSEIDSSIAHRLQKRVGRVREECGNLETILNEFLQFARAGQPDLEEACLNEIVSDFLSFLEAQAAESGVELIPHLDVNIPKIPLDRKLVRQVLSNLGRNALQAMVDGGTLEFLTTKNADAILLQVIDTGEGMDQKTVSRMFQAFFSTRTGGSGLGLPTVRRIIEAHGGSIQCESEPGRGTCFTIRFPIAAAPANVG